MQLHSGLSGVPGVLATGMHGVVELSIVGEVPLTTAEFRVREFRAAEVFEGLSGLDLKNKTNISWLLPLPIFLTRVQGADNTIEALFFSSLKFILSFSGSSGSYPLLE